MSPLRTLTSWGNSSIDIERTNRPTLVRRASSESNCPCASRSSVIVLNLTILKILPSFPGRSWRKKAPAPLLAKCNHNVTTNNNGLRHISTKNAIQKSKNRLKKYLYILDNQSCTYQLLICSLRARRCFFPKLLTGI